MVPLIRKLALIGVSEYILVFVFTLSMLAAVAVTSANVNFRQVILPPPPPSITSILGDRQSRAVLVIGKSSLPNATVWVFAFSDPIVVETTADDRGIFFAVFTEDMLRPGVHQFTAAVAISGADLTDSAPQVAVHVEEDYTVKSAEGIKEEGESTAVKIANAEAATSELLRVIIRNQKAARTVTPAEVPAENTQANRARLIQFALFIIIALQSVLLLIQRARRKKRQGQGFFHLGRGFYRLRPVSPKAGHPE